MEKPHKKLDVWRMATELVGEVYRMTGSFPARATYSLVDLIRRAAIGIPSNIAEGAARQTKKEFINFLDIAQGSSSELDTQRTQNAARRWRMAYSKSGMDKE